MQGDTGGNSILTDKHQELISERFGKLFSNDEMIIDMHPGQYSLHHLIIYLCEKIGGEADIQLSTFSISEEVLNAFVMMREAKLLKSIAVIVDSNFATKKSPLIFYAETVIDDLYLTANHTKIAVISKDGKPRFLITGSANLNYNPRWEYYMATSNKYLLQAHNQLLEDLRMGIL